MVDVMFGYMNYIKKKNIPISYYFYFSMISSHNVQI